MSSSTFSYLFIYLFVCFRCLNHMSSPAGSDLLTARWMLQLEVGSCLSWQTWSTEIWSTLHNWRLWTTESPWQMLWEKSGTLPMSCGIMQAGATRSMVAPFLLVGGFCFKNPFLLQIEPSNAYEPFCLLQTATTCAWRRKNLSALSDRSFLGITQWWCWCGNGVQPWHAVAPSSWNLQNKHHWRLYIWLPWPRKLVFLQVSSTSYLDMDLQVNYLYAWERCLTYAEDDFESRTCYYS